MPILGVLNGEVLLYKVTYANTKVSSMKIEKNETVDGHFIQ